MLAQGLNGTLLAACHRTRVPLPHPTCLSRSSMTASSATMPIRESESRVPGDGGRAMTVERFDPEGVDRPLAALLLHGADGLRYRGPAYRAMARHLAGHGLRTLLPHYFERTGTDGHARGARPLDFLGW